MPNLVEFKSEPGDEVIEYTLNVTEGAITSFVSTKNDVVSVNSSSQLAALRISRRFLPS